MEISGNKFYRTGGSLSWTERESMIHDYLTGSYTKAEIWEKYTGQNEEHGQLLQWMRKLGYLAEERRTQRPLKINYRIQNITEPILSNDQYKEKTNDELLKRIAQLEKMLEMEKLRSEGYDLMIDIAEKELKIPIRKKSDTK